MQKEGKKKEKRRKKSFTSLLPAWGALVTPSAVCLSDGFPNSERRCLLLLQFLFHWNKINQTYINFGLSFQVRLLVQNQICFHEYSTLQCFFKEYTGIHTPENSKNKLNNLKGVP